MYLMIDNYDSFTYNLRALFASQGAKVKVIRNDEFEPADDYEGIIISPGPSSPEHSGSSMEYLKRYAGNKPIFGVCLGMQCIGSHQGYKISRAATVKHGKVDPLEVVRESVLFKGLPRTISVVRYHSLAVEADDDQVTALSMTDGTVMAIEDKEKKLFGVQFHPESIMSDMGTGIIRNFLDFVESSRPESVERQATAEDLLRMVLAGENLKRKEAELFFEEMASGRMTDAQIAASLVSLKQKGETVEEMAALVQVLNRHKKNFGGRVEGGVDTCGTGGDGKSTVNVSTAVSLILAAMGHPVVKHGNRAQSGKVGSADILELLGMDLNYLETTPEKFFTRHNYVFMMAPHYHPALKGIGKVRRELKIPTIFNYVGPLVNPADPDFQVIGISRTDRLDFIASVLREMGRKNVTVYASRDGYDEVSSQEPTECRSVTESGIEDFIIEPAGFFEPFPMPRVESAEDATRLFLAGLRGEDKNLAALLALNTALALKTMKAADMESGYSQALECVMSGNAAQKLMEVTGGDLS